MLNLLVGSLFILDAVGSIIGWTGFIASKIANLEHDMGFAPGQGLLTPSVQIQIDSRAKSVLGRDICANAEVLDVLQRYVGKTYMMTVVEETQVKAMVSVMNSAVKRLLTNIHAGQMAEAVEIHKLAEQAADSLAVYLWQFPPGRVS